ncbi:unnamed protein product [Acanthoscelides obtectus]|uniref:Uncharacterized protein n=1 Tax=Acanthoscelides obtectus TaxID=200917 RepID=A0A9P0PR25_ACAOB|nr:unnamed protein product [Acanthoscelides obtectus]CAK1627336.1 hypothetical protein AOBTE_LOCUS4529 [Acanthoscelides obtectus]
MLSCIEQPLNTSKEDVVRVVSLRTCEQYSRLSYQGL